MYRRKRQTGASIIFWLVVVAVAGFALIIALRLFPLYIKAYTVRSVLDDVAKETHANDSDADEAWHSISRRLDVKNIDDINRASFFFRREAGVITLALRYEERTDLIGNLDGVASFELIETRTKLEQNTGGAATF
jgi:hypothetical protein